MDQQEIESIYERFGLDPHLGRFLSKTTRVVIVIIGIITALGTLGVNVSALVAGLGISGFAIGFAMKDAVSNLLAGIMILLYKPFQIKDNITIAGYTGVIMSIDLRYTIIKSDEETVFIPNSKLFTDPITVHSE